LILLWYSIGLLNECFANIQLSVDFLEVAEVYTDIFKLYDHAEWGHDDRTGDNTGNLSATAGRFTVRLRGSDDWEDGK